MRQPERPLATTEYIVRQVDDRHKPLSVVCAELDLTMYLGARLLEAGRSARKAARAQKQQKGKGI